MALWCEAAMAATNKKKSTRSADRRASGRVALARDLVATEDTRRLEVIRRQLWEDLITRRLEETAINCVEMTRHLAPVIEAVCIIERALRAGGKVLICGNGGSAADAQHLAAELMGRFQKDRAPLAALALTTDTSALTAIANDYAFADVFARQVRGIGRPGDVLIGISTSGASENVLRAFAAARDAGLKTIGLTGASGGRFPDACDVTIAVTATATARVQELHIAIGHAICELIEETLA
jgi:D-sedoheptulose 7-phosphate isomerase